MRFNFYDIVITDPIVFEGNAFTYLNFTKAGSRGIEVEYRLNQGWGYVTSNFAYYTSKSNNKVALYEVPDNKDQTLGMPGYRFNMNGSIKILKALSLNPSFNLIGKQTGITGLDVDDNYVYTQFDSQFFANIFLRFNKGNFDAGLGVFDILNERQRFVQPYASGHAPLPGHGREYVIKLAYTINFKNQ